MTITNEDGRLENVGRLLNGCWQLRLRSAVIVCPNCGALLPRTAEPTCCALCGSQELHD